MFSTHCALCFSFLQSNFRIKPAHIVEGAYNLFRTCPPASKLLISQRDLRIKPAHNQRTFGSGSSTPSPMPEHWLRFTGGGRETFITQEN